MVIVRASKGHSDGLDPVFNAYRQLKEIYEAAESVDRLVGVDEEGNEFWDTMLKLPGSGEVVDPNDANELNQLERWLVERLGKGIVDMAKTEIWTDGSCAGNPGKGGWAALLRSGDHEKVLSGREQESTNNRMEITAAIEALKALKTPCSVRLHSDSQYLVNTMTLGWKRRANLDLWEQLDKAAEPHEVEWIWVRGHANSEENNLVDLAARAMTE